MGNDHAPKTPRNGFFWATLAACCLGLIMSTAMIIYLFCQNVANMMAEARLLSGVIVYVCILLLNCLPYVVLAMIGLVARRYRIITIVVFVGAALITAAGEALLYSSFLIHPDPQSGIALIVIPIDQMICVAILMGIVGPIYYFTRGRVHPAKG